MKDHKDITMEIQPDFDFILEEGQNTSTNLRKVSWNGREPKLDIRKWSYSEGGERAMRGVTLTDEGGDELASVLVEQGYGDTKRIAKAIMSRDDYNIDDEVAPFEDDGSEEYYDPSELLG